jgi:ribonucleoside-diphosphate reductase alpha chain
MARAAGQAIPVMDGAVKTEGAGKPAGTAKPGQTRKEARTLAGPYGASFDGKGARGLTIERRWTRPDIHPYDEIAWETRTAAISSETGKTVFEQKDVEVPSFWSQLATNVVVSKYFRGHIGTPEREHSVRQLIDRVVNTIAAWAETQRYFATDEDLAAFRAELTHLLVHQKMAFNSPVWFNVGIEPKPQCSACFINSVADNMGSIMDLAKTEAMLFKFGSGAGSNLSPIRSSREKMSGGGIASGPVSFMKGYDAFAGVIKCLTGDTYITTGGGLLRIDEAIETEGPVGFEESDALTLNTPAGPTRISHIYRSPLASVRSAKLRTGLELTGTHEHPVLTLSPGFELEWKRLAELQAGDRVAVERRRELWPSRAPSLDEFSSDLVVERRKLRYPTEMTPALARLLGYLVSEGSVEVERFRFSSADPEVMADYCRCVEAVFGVDPSSQVRSRIHPTTGVATEFVELSWKGALQFLGYCGLPATLSARKNVPISVRRSPKSLVLEFLGAYTEGDGHVGGSRVDYATASPRLAQELQLLTLNLGAVGRRSTVKGYEHLVFLGAESARLARLLHPYLVTPRKRSAAADAVENDRARTRNPNLDVIPGLVPALRALSLGSGWFRSVDGGLVRTGFGIFNRASDNVSYARTEAVPGLLNKVGQLSPTLAGTLESVLDDQYLWDEVVSISDAGEALTYDFTVPDVHAFVSNGIVSHNSGGKTRRAAKMVILDADHPDVLDFIDSKMLEEKKAWALIEQGYDPSFTGEAYASVYFQNANHSVRVTDDFMRAVESDGEWTTHAVVGGETMGTYRARDVFRRMADAAWVCGDPGIQYDTTINDWNPVSNSDRQYATNPCVTGDTLVATDEGWRSIESLVGERVNIIGADGQPHPVDRVFPTGTKPVFELRTRSGYRLRITADHKVVTTRGDVAVKDLQPDDRIFLNAPGFGREQVAPALAEAIGLAVGDGCLTWTAAGETERPMIILTMHANEAGVLEAVAAELNDQKARLKAVGSVGRNDDIHVSMGATGSRLAFASRPVVEQFMSYAVLDEGSTLKRFKPAVYSLDRASVAAVLRGLFTADGTVVDSGSRSQYVGLDSTSLELLEQVQRLLLGFGIKSKLYENRRGGKLEQLLPDGRGGMRSYAVKETHSLRITRSSRVRFEREIGFVTGSPKAATLARLNVRVSTYSDELVDGVGSITPLGAEPVFDLTEGATSHFVANGLVVHNCSEFSFLNDTSCNLASVNLMKFVGEDGEFNVDDYRHACRITITAQEIIVDNGGYPTPKIEENSHRFRPLGIGYANLGALLMSRGLAYDSDDGRNFAAALTAIMTAETYRQSAIIARDHGGPFVEFAKNRTPFLRVIGMHRDAAYEIPEPGVPAEVGAEARRLWDETLELGKQHGYRNAQISLLAPTGTIAFMMDCDTTGIEPDIALIKYKKLVGEGFIKIVNQTVPAALRKLGYSPDEVQGILDYVNERETIEGAPSLKPEHLPVFDCAFKPVNGERSIHYMGHVRMMGAVQPFLSGAISKTVNMPEAATADEIEQVYLEGWKRGLKAIAIYRDGSKRSQPLSTGKKKDEGSTLSEADAAVVEQLKKQLSAAQAEASMPHRRRLPAERSAVTHKFDIAGHEGYITVGLYPDGQPGEIFLKMAKEGSTVSGLMDTFATAISLSLQYGVPLRDLVNKFAHVRFEPSGFTGNTEIPIAKSTIDYIFRWLGSRFLSEEDKANLGLIDRSAVVEAPPPSAGSGPMSLGAASLGTSGSHPLGNPAPAPAAAASATAAPPASQPEPRPEAKGGELAVIAAAPASKGHAGNGKVSANGGGLTLNLGGTKVAFAAQADAPSCMDCGSIMIRNGSCYKCLNCGSTSGCS